MKTFSCLVALVCALHEQPSKAQGAAPQNDQLQSTHRLAPVEESRLEVTVRKVGVGEILTRCMPVDQAQKGAADCPVELRRSSERSRTKPTIFMQGHWKGRSGNTLVDEWWFADAETTVCCVQRVGRIEERDAESGKVSHFNYNVIRYGGKLDSASRHVSVRVFDDFFNPTDEVVSQLNASVDCDRLAISTPDAGGASVEIIVYGPIQNGSSSDRVLSAYYDCACGLWRSVELDRIAVEKQEPR